MVEVVSSFIDTVVAIYSNFIRVVPDPVAMFIDLSFIIVLVAVYAIFIWKFYRLVATKNLLELNLQKYNRFEHSFLIKLAAGFFYFLEYILILPSLIFFWFVVFAILLFLIAESLTTAQVLLVATVIVAAIRMTAYYNEDLSKDVAKMFPFTLLAISLISPGFFDIERIVGHVTQIPFLLTNILYYLLFIIGLEIVLRFFEFLFSLFELEEGSE